MHFLYHLGSSRDSPPWQVSDSQFCAKQCKNITKKLVKIFVKTEHLTDLCQRACQRLLSVLSRSLCPLETVTQPGHLGSHVWLSPGPIFVPQLLVVLEDF